MLFKDVKVGQRFFDSYTGYFWIKQSENTAQLSDGEGEDYFNLDDEVEKYVKLTDKGWPKNIRNKTIVHNYIVLDTVEEKEKSDFELLKLRALAKLTPKEIEALGL